jgi:hypothetical protein
MQEQKKFRWLSSPNMLDIARDGYATEAITSRFARMRKHRKAGKGYAYPKVFHLNMVKRVQMKNYV